MQTKAPEAVLAQLPEQLRSLAIEIAASYAEKPNVECVLMIGSLTAGLGNPYSDLDFYVVTDEERTAVPALHRGEGARVDVERRPRGWLDLIVREAATFTTTSSEVAHLMRGGSHLDTVGRLYYAVPLIDRGEFARAHAYLLEHLTSFRRQVIAREASLLHGLLEDCLGALLADDVAMGTLVSQELLRGALQAFLVGCGSVYLGKKWIPARLRSAASATAPVGDLLALCAGNAGLEDRAAVTARIRYAQSAVAAAITDGWSEPAAASWPGWPSLEQQGPGRRQDWMAVRLSDAIVLAQTRGKTVKLPERALRIWGAYPGAGGADERVVDRLLSLGILQ